MHVIDVLRRHASERVARYGHDRLRVFGIGADLDMASWRTLFRQLVALGYVRVAHDAHGALKLNEKARPVLRGEEQVEVRELARSGPKPRREERRGASSDLELSPEALARLERLKAWRRDAAREQGVPAYVIFHDRTLAEIAVRRPLIAAELASVSGVGAAKLERYGDAVIRLMQD